MIKDKRALLAICRNGKTSWKKKNVKAEKHLLQSKNKTPMYKMEVMKRVCFGMKRGKMKMNRNSV